MIPQLLIPLLAVLGSVATPAPAVAQQVTHVVPKQLVSAQQKTEQASRAVQVLRARHQKALKAKRSLDSRYRSQLAEIDKLKRRRSSWRRDRMLRAAYRESQTTARKLATHEKSVRALSAKLRSANQALWRAIDAELLSSTDPKRRATLSRLRRHEKQSPAKQRRRIVLPDDHIDPLASREELEEQARLIEKSERQLAREIASLGQRERRFLRMAKLRKTRARAGELSVLDDNNPRRTTGRLLAANNRSTGSAGNDSADEQAEPSAPAPGDNPPGDDNQGGGSGFDNESATGGYDLVLADIVDTPTLNAYRTADQSGDPARKAKAASRMRAQAVKQLRRLQKRRKQMLDKARSQRRR